MDIWTRLKKEIEGTASPSGEETWTDDLGSDRKAETGNAHQDFENRPLEPESKKPRLSIYVKWLFFLLIILYAVLSYYRIPLLNRMGEYLVVQDPLEKADVIVCMAGNPLERGIAAAELYQNGMAERIYIPRGPEQDGAETLKIRGIPYPGPEDLLLQVLYGLDVPQDACRVSRDLFDTLLEQVAAVKSLCLEEGYRTLIVVTSPIQARRTSLVYRAVMGDDWTVLMVPTPYSGFRPRTWWKEEKYREEVLFEFQKLFFQRLRFL